MMMLSILMATVTRKRIETAIAVFFSFFLLMSMFVLPRCDESNSEVMRSIMAVMASRRLMSQKPRGNVIVRFAPLLPVCGILWSNLCHLYWFAAFLL